MDKAQLIEAFQRQVVGAFYLDETDLKPLAHYLRERNFLASEEQILSVGKAGQGNMNLTLRVITNQRSFILKQSRPWVEKYPQITAPAHRSSMEGYFYQLVTPYEGLSTSMPEYYDCDSVSNLLFLEDLGQAETLESLYQADALLSDDLARQAMQWLRQLHALRFETKQREGLVNLEMRKLNHEHIFHYPLVKENGLNLDDITPGLQRLADALKENKPYVGMAEAMGQLYLEPRGNTLLHGDFYPGSWMELEDQLYVIDPEFSYFGEAAFDLGVIMAHMVLSQQPKPMQEAILKLSLIHI